MKGAPLVQRISALLDEQVQCVLATVNAGHPELHLMAFAVTPELDCVFLASAAQTRKVRNMQAHPEVALLWDNRTRRTQDHIHGVALGATGRARRLAGDEAAAASGVLLHRNDTLAPLLDIPEVAVMAIAISQFRWVQGYGAVEEYAPV